MSAHAWEAGALLDAEVARRVMGLSNVRPEHLPPSPFVQFNLHIWSEDDDAEWGIEREVPDYSTEIAAAWEVVEHMNRAGWQMQLTGDGEPWACAFWQSLRNATVNRHGDGEAETAPLAICRAALAAVVEGAG